MSIQKRLAVVSFCLMVLSHNLFSQIVLQGTVTDNGGEYLGNGAVPLLNALVTVTDQADTNRSFSGYTNEQGEYSIVIWATGVNDNNSNNPGRFNLLQNYPNPFNPSTVITYELSQPANISIEIYNVLGQKIKTLFDGHQFARVGQVVWDATNDLGQGVPAGVYFYSMQAGDVRINKKMLLIDGQQGSANLAVSHSTGTYASGQTVLTKQMSDQYILQVTGADIAPYVQQNLEITGNMTLDIIVNRTLTDIDGNVYHTVKIGDQWWMAENLKVTQYRNGDPIPNVTDETEWTNLTTGAYCNYDNDANNVATYGHLYNWFVVRDIRYIAPEGWHVPSAEEWLTLADYLGGADVAGGKLKETGTTHWTSPNEAATNESGFTALPGGYRASTTGSFYNLGNRGYWWSSTSYFNPIFNTNNALIRYIFYNYSTLIAYNERQEYGYSVRCLKEN